MRLLLPLLLAYSLSACAPGKHLALQDTAVWQATGNANWRYAGKELVGTVRDGQVGALMTTRSYDNFEFSVDFRPDATVNSGVFVRCATRQIDMRACYELNIWDDNPSPPNRTGAVVLRAEPLNQVQTIDRWSTYRVRAEGGRIRAWIDDTPVADLEDDELPSGYLGLQASGTGTIRFRKARLSEL